mmetsp:Transcript_19542/g.28553  ORF Transcript_19542/g.28553 Transcript_19542/m.28553 type:complete len:96 (-) Transcript_19542:35-322(-)
MHTWNGQWGRWMDGRGWYEDGVSMKQRKGWNELIGAKYSLSFLKKNTTPDVMKKAYERNLLAKNEHGRGRRIKWGISECRGCGFPKTWKTLLSRQ